MDDHDGMANLILPQADYPSQSLVSTPCLRINNILMNIGGGE